MFLLGFSVKPAVERHEWIRGWVQTDNATLKLVLGRLIGVAVPKFVLGAVVFRSRPWFGLVIWIAVQAVAAVALWRAMPRIMRELVQQLGVEDDE